MQLSSEPAAGSDGEGSLGARLLAAAFALPLAGPAVADSPPERAQISLKVLDYKETQPGATRIIVRAPALGLTLPVAGGPFGDWAVTGSFVSDSISGASPAYHTSALTRVDDLRRAIDLNATRYFASGATLALGRSVSKEEDYLSHATSLQGSLASDDRNTTVNAGVALTRDTINPVNRAVRDERKRTAELLLGATQVLTPQDIVQATWRHARGRGYFSDPYKVFDNRPRSRDAQTLLVRWNHHFASTETSARFSYRYFRDTFGVRSHTFGAEFAQPLPWGLTVTPLARLYTQTAARFYVDAPAGSENSPFAPNPPESALFYSQDQRLSNFGARTFGIKLAKQIGSDWLVDVKVERYAQRAAWSLQGHGSPNLAPFHARSVQVGASYSF